MSLRKNIESRFLALKVEEKRDLSQLVIFHTLDLRLKLGVRPSFISFSDTVCTLETFELVIMFNPNRYLYDNGDYGGKIFFESPESKTLISSTQNFFVLDPHRPVGSFVDSVREWAER